MNLHGLTLCLTSPVTAVAEGPVGTFPFAGGTIGFETDWTLTGDFSWDAGTSSIRVNGSAGSAVLTGAALTAFNAAIANSTLYTMESTLADVVGFGQALVTAKEGVSAAVEGEDSGPTLNGITSGTGSGLVIAASAEFPPDWRMTTFTLASP